MNQEQETKCEIAKRFVYFFLRHRDERNRYETLEVKRKELEQQGLTSQAATVKQEAQRAGGYAYIAAEGIQRQMRVFRDLFYPNISVAAVKLQEICDWLAKTPSKDKWGNALRDKNGNIITMIDPPAPQVAEMVNWSLDFYRQWNFRLSASREKKEYFAQQ